jgi:hypothetical protein
VIGLYFLLVAMLWLAISIVLAVAVSRRISPGSRRTVIGMLAVAVLLPVPFVDQIVGAIQFKRVCARTEGIQVNREKTKDRTVYRVYIPPSQIGGTWLPVYETQWRFADMETGEVLLSYRTFEARPGFIRVTPLMFNPNCGPAGHTNARALVRQFGMILGERPSALPQDTK